MNVEPPFYAVFVSSWVLLFRSFRSIFVMLFTSSPPSYCTNTWNGITRVGTLHPAFIRVDSVLLCAFLPIFQSLSVDSSNDFFDWSHICSCLYCFWTESESRLINCLFVGVKIKQLACVNLLFSLHFCFRMYLNSTFIRLYTVKKKKKEPVLFLFGRTTLCCLLCLNFFNLTSLPYLITADSCF